MRNDELLAQRRTPSSRARIDNSALEVASSRCSKADPFDAEMGQERRFRPDPAMSALAPIVTAKADMRADRTSLSRPLARKKAIVAPALTPSYFFGAGHTAHPESFRRAS